MLLASICGRNEFVLGVLGVACFGLIGCADEEATQIVVVAWSNLDGTDEAPALDTLALSLEYPDHHVENLPKEPLLGEDALALPATFGFWHQGGLTGPVGIRLTGHLEGVVVVEQRVRTAFLPRRSVRLDLLLAMECAGVDCGDEDRSCFAETRCRSVEVASEALPDWNGIDPEEDPRALQHDWL